MFLSHHTTLHYSNPSSNYSFDKPARAIHLIENRKKVKCLDCAFVLIENEIQTFFVPKFIRAQLFFIIIKVLFYDYNFISGILLLAVPLSSNRNFAYLG